MRVIVSVVVVAFLSSCASAPEDIAAQNISTIPYESYSCDQISRDLIRVEQSVSELHGRLDKTASDDEAQMAIGIILFWPVLFFLEGGDGPEAAEYGRLKGEKQALEKVAIQKNCGT